MDDLGVKLHPVKKLQLWQAVKKMIFAKMDNNIITPERADEILGSIKPKIIEVDSPEQAKKLYLSLPQMYSDLAPIAHRFEMQEEESIEKLLVLLLDVVIDKEGLDFASELLEKMNNPEEQKNLIHELEEKYLVELRICSDRLSQQFV